MTALYWPPIAVVTISAPGAETEVQSPKVEKEVTLSFLSVAPTAIRPGTSLPAKAEGTFFELVPVLPIEQMKGVPFDITYSAARRVDSTAAG
ncbi:hypothetical protein D3C86_1998940 [compost metagenome]